MDATDIKSANVILFHGPPFVGKNTFCRDTLSKTHKIIYPRLLYKENPRFGIRDVALEAYKKIKEGHKVVILDTNENRKTRESYIRLLKKKVGDHLTFATISILPKHGCQQLLWSQEFYRAKRSHSRHTEHNDYPITEDYDDEHILKWFDERTATDVTYRDGIVDEVLDVEGSTVHHMVRTLQAVTTYKVSGSRSGSHLLQFDVPALFIQWECISGVLDDDDDDDGDPERLLASIVSVFTLWSKQNPQGRIIVVCDGSHIRTVELILHTLVLCDEKLCSQMVTEAVVGEKSCSQQVKDIKKVLTRIVTFPTCVPIYVHHIGDPGATASYVAPPQPGVLAFLQHRHRLHITAKDTLYIYESSSHKKLAERAGVRHVKGSRLIKQPSLVTVGHIAVIPSIPDMLHHMTIVPESGDQMEARLPLYDMAAEFHHNFVHTDLGVGRSEYLFAKDWKTVERLQELYSSKAKQIVEPESVVQKYDIANSPSYCPLDTSDVSEQSFTERDLPKWMMSKPTSLTSKPSLDSSLSVESFGQEKKVRKSVYVMTEKELVEVASEILKQAGKQDVLDNIEKGRKLPKNITDLDSVKHDSKPNLKQSKPSTSPSHHDLMGESNRCIVFNKDSGDVCEFEESEAKNISTSVTQKRQLGNKLRVKCNKVLSAFEFHRHLEPRCTQPSNCEPEYAPTASKKSKYTDDESCDLFESTRMSMDLSVSESSSVDRVIPRERTSADNIREKTSADNIREKTYADNIREKTSADNKRERTSAVNIRSSSGTTTNSNINSTMLDEFLDTTVVRKPSPRKTAQQGLKPGRKMTPATSDTKSRQPNKQQNKNTSRQSPDLSILDDIFL